MWSNQNVNIQPWLAFAVNIPLPSLCKSQVLWLVTPLHYCQPQARWKIRKEPPQIWIFLNLNPQCNGAVLLKFWRTPTSSLVFGADIYRPSYSSRRGSRPYDSYLPLLGANAQEPEGDWTDGRPARKPCHWRSRSKLFSRFVRMWMKTDCLNVFFAAGVLHLER